MELDSSIYEKEYLEHKGVRCPFCMSDDITTTGPAHINSFGNQQQGCKCLNCKATWDDEYSLVGISNLEIP